MEKVDTCIGTVVLKQNSSRNKTIRHKKKKLSLDTMEAILVTGCDPDISNLKRKEEGC